MIVDDQRSFGEALVLALSLTEDFKAVGAAGDVSSGLDVTSSASPDLVIADYRLSGSSTGVDLARKIRERESEMQGRRTHRVPIVILTGYPAPQVIRESSELENVSVMSKNDPLAELIAGFRLAVTHQQIATPKFADPYGLSRGEIEVLEFLADGLSAAEIAERLSLSLHAIRSRIKSLLQKIGASSQVEAIAAATSAGLVVPSHRSRAGAPDDADDTPANSPGPNK